MKHLTRHFLSLLLALALLAPAGAAVHTHAAAATIPTISIVSVVKDQNVTIETHNYPAHVLFTARMGKFGTLGIDGTVVGTTDSGSGGSFQVTYNIPAALQGQNLIAIRLEGVGGFFSYNFFENATTGSITPAPTTVPTTVPTTAPTTVPTTVPTSTVPARFTGIPTFSILSVVRDTSVTIQTKNFPPHQTFTVRMGKFGTLGINGTKVTTTDSGNGGAFQATYTIPDAFKGLAQIAIRLESPQGFFAYNWFFNSTTGASPTSAPGSTTTPVPTTAPGATVTPVPSTAFPSFIIVSVIKDGSVTIKGKNFPANQTFTVRMGKFGTLGINGVKVTTTDSGAGGELNATYTIPDSLKGLGQIAIRLESPQGFFAFNWFFNSTSVTG